MNDTITVDGVELSRTSRYYTTKMPGRWTCLVCRQNFGMKILAAYNRSSSGCCVACAARLPGAQSVAPAASPAVARPRNLSRVGSQSGGSYTDISEDC